MGQDFTATITNPERRAEWEDILGTATVHVKAPFPTKADLPSHPDALVYELDLDFLTEEQREKLVIHLAVKFGLPSEYVGKNLDVHGVPILAKDCVISVANPQRWL